MAASSPRMTAPGVLARKGAKPPLVMVTAYDAPSARTVDAAGADMILVGDSLAMVVLGYDDTLQVTTADMAHHVAAVARSRPNALVVADLPWLSYHVNREETVRNAASLVRAGAGAVKLEGGLKRIDAVKAILDTEIPVMGHIGLTPQSIHALGGFKVQGKELDAAQALTDDAVAPRRGGLLRDRARVRARRGRTHDHRIGRRPDHRYRCGAALRRSGARVARPARLRGRWSPPPEVRPGLRGVRARRRERDRAVLRRRACRHVPVERRDVSHDRPDGRGPRSVRRVGRKRARAHPIARRCRRGRGSR